MASTNYQKALAQVLDDVCKKHEVELVPLLLSLLEPLSGAHTMVEGFMMEEGTIMSDINFITQSCNGGKVPTSLADALRVLYTAQASMSKHNAEVHRKAAEEPDDPAPPQLRLAQANWMAVVARHQLAFSELLEGSMKIWEQRGIDARANLRRRESRHNREGAEEGG